MPERPSFGPLVVAWEDWKVQKINVTDESKRNTFYTAESNVGTHQLIFHTPHRSDPIAAVTYTLDAKSVSVTMNNASLEIKPANWAGTEWVYQSPTFLNTEGGRNQIMWEGKLSMMCTNENGMTIARFKAAKWAMHRIGTIEFMDENISQQAKDEIVVTGVALMAMVTEIMVMSRAAPSANASVSYMVTNAVIQSNNAA
jgi:hypothetical protein